MPPYIPPVTTQTYPPRTIPVATPSFPCYSFGREAGYNDAPTISTEYPETMPANDTAGRQFNVRTVMVQHDTENAPSITWQTEYPSAPADVNVVLEGSLDDNVYATVDTSTNAAGEIRVVALGAAHYNFLRIRVVSSTGGTAPTIIAKFVV